MKIQRDLTTTFYIFISGTYLIIGARSFARAPDTPETSYFYLLGLITWVLATLVWMQQVDNRAARISYLMSIGLMSVCSVDATFSIGEGTWSSRIVPIAQFLAATILPCLFLHCFLIFPAEKKIALRYQWVLKALYVPGIVLFLAMSFFYFKGNNYFREFFLVQLPPLEGISTGFLFFYSIAGQLLLLHTCFAAPSASQRRQARWLLLGIVAGTLPQAIFTTIPKVWDVSIPYARASAYTLCLIPICYVVAIIRHRLMNIELIINRSLVYMLVSGFALGIYLLSIQGLTLFFHTAIRSRTVTAVSVLIVAVLFAPAKTRIQNLIDRAFDRETYNYRQTLLALSQTLHSILDLEILVDTLLRQVTRAMHISRGVVMYRVSAAEPEFVPEALIGMDSLPSGVQVKLFPPLLELLKKAEKPLDFSNQPLDRNNIQLLVGKTDFANSAQTEGFIAFLRSAVWIPFVTRTKELENLVGLLVLGQKSSEEPYTQADLALLGTLAHQGATAIENATLYAQLSMRTKAMEEAREQLMATYLDTLGGTMPKSESGNLMSDFNNIAAALKESHDRLRQLDRLKSQFLDNVSHELRTPLTHIKGFVDNLLAGIGGKLSRKQTSYLLRVTDNCDRLIRLINDLLDLSRIESGQISLQFERMPLYPILDVAVAGMQPMADEKQVQINLDCARDIVASVDIDKMKQIMTNLLDNAVKYTERGGHVWVNVTSQPDQDVQICVEDTGMGIDDADLNFIFDRFHRVDDSKNSGVGGIGLGLPIVKNLVELHGGKIWAESEVGVGSRFYVTLKGGQHR
ncbi:MAG: ATP-binding protein [Candidatus Poribacteria bacterium]